MGHVKGFMCPLMPSLPPLLLPLILSWLWDWLIRGTRRGPCGRHDKEHENEGIIENLSRTQISQICLKSFISCPFERYDYLTILATCNRFIVLGKQCCPTSCSRNLVATGCINYHSILNILIVCIGLIFQVWFFIRTNNVKWIEVNFSFISVFSLDLFDVNININPSW